MVPNPFVIIIITPVFTGHNQIGPHYSRLNNHIIHNSLCPKEFVKDKVKQLGIQLNRLRVKRWDNIQI